jgi:hypothetical protein
MHTLDRLRDAHCSPANHWTAHVAALPRRHQAYGRDSDAGGTMTNPELSPVLTT